MEVVVDGFKTKVYCYYCDDCEERFYLERLVSPHIVYCPSCGDTEVAVSSGHLDELYGTKK